MSYLYARPMPVGRIGQKHGNHKTDNNYGYLASLTGPRGADVDLRTVWRNPKRRTKAAGIEVYALHGDTPASNGYRHIMRGNVCRPMTDKELHRPLSKWAAARVADWRRGRTRNSARPRTYEQMVGYVKRHGGTIIGELKSRIFATHQWVSDQLVAICKRLNHAPWFKALANMWGIAGKCIHMARAGGWTAIIFGKHLAGHAARQRAGRPIRDALPPDVQARTRIW